jgi:hypothetical protein
MVKDEYFILDVSNDAFSSSEPIASSCRMICGLERLWPNLRSTHVTGLMGLRKTTEELQSGFPVTGPRFGPRTPEYGRGILTIQPQRSL